jgi:hypothetical protein
LFEYDENGRFIKKIGSIGIGPGEYIELCDFDVSENGTVIINNIKQLIFYDGDGKYQHSVMVDIMPLSIKIVKDNRILIYGSGEEYAIYEIDMSGKIIKKEFKNTYQGLKTGKGIHFLSYGQDKTITQIGFSNDFIFYDFNDKNFSYTKLVCDENILSSAKEEEVWHAYNDDMDKYADVYSNYNTIYRVAGSNSHLYFSQGYYNDDDGNARLYIQVLNIQTGNIEHVISDKDTNDITFAGKPFYFLYRALVTDAQDCFISSVHLDSVWKGLKKNSEFKDSSNYKQLEELFKNKSEKEIEDENPMLVEFVFK